MSMGDSPYFQDPALRVLWQAVTSDPMDFQSWTALLSQVESVGSLEDAQRVYDEFLQQFPLCFGYWKKYANLVSRQHLAPPRAQKTTGTKTTTTTASTAQQGTPSSCTTPTAGVGGSNSGNGGGDDDDDDDAQGGRGGGRGREVFERAVVAAPFCLELWEAFAEGVLGEGTGKGTGGLAVGSSGGGGGGVCGKVEDTRRVLERALEAVGDNPRSGAIWRKCIAFEEAQGGQHSSLTVTSLYERAFGHRLEDLEVLWVDFKEFLDRTPWAKLEPPVTAAAPAAAAASAACDAEATVAYKVSDAAVAVVASAGDASNNKKGSTDADKKAMLVKILEGKRKVSLRGRQRRESFERRITRPHFHVKPLDDAQLSAWSQYLDFELAQAASSTTRSAAPARMGRKRPRVGQGGDNGGSSSGGGGGGGGGSGSGDGNEEVERLFERCLVPCASYWWLWERYALWKESIWGLEPALEVAQRACNPFLRWRPEALFFRAELLERLGRNDEARGVYERVLTEVAPGLVEGACKLACFERRCGNREAAAAAYRSLLPPPLGLPREGGGGGGGTGNGGSWSHWEETTETTRPYLYMQLARFQHRVAGDPGSARATFRAAVADIPGSRELWLAFLEFEAGQPQALHAGRVEAAFRMAVEEQTGYHGDEGRAAGIGNASFNTNTTTGNGFHDDDDDARRLTVEDRADLWEWFEEFVEDLSMDVAKVMSVRAEHRAWTRAHGTGAHEATAATAAAAAAAAATSPSPAVATSGDGSLRASRTTNSNGGKEGPTTTTVASRTIAPPGDPLYGRQLPAAAVGSVGAAANAAAAAAAATAAGAQGRLGYAGGSAAVGGGVADGSSFGPLGDSQRRQMWHAYQQQQLQLQQQQQQALQQNMQAASPLPLAGARTVGGSAAQASAVGLDHRPWKNDMVDVAFHGDPGVANAFDQGTGAPGFPVQQHHHQEQQQHQQIDLQVQNQEERHRRIYARSYPPPTQQQQQQQHGRQGWLG